MAEKQKKDNFFKRIASYVKATRSEVKKVTWPSRKQVINNTGVVIVCIAVVGVFIFLLNIIFGAAFSFLSSGSNNAADATDYTEEYVSEIVTDATEPSEATSEEQL